jgi:WD40 repeat protein
MDEPTILEAEREGSSRVAGMSLKHTLLDGHKEPVTGLFTVIHDNKHWLVSTGWDRRICIWDLDQFRLHSVFCNREQGTSTNLASSSGKEELAADGVILDLEYSSDRLEFAYTSADKQAYIRQFSPNGDQMVLRAVLQGHESEVTKIRWHKLEKVWITGSEDRTIRIWVGYIINFTT